MHVRNLILNDNYSQKTVIIKINLLLYIVEEHQVKIIFFSDTISYKLGLVLKCM